jgi:uncharacterized protein involved in exopolysaccharide biosynthesis
MNLSQIQQNLSQFQQGPALDWRTYWYLVKRRKWFIFIPTIITMLAGLYFALSTVKIFKSQTTILVQGSTILTRDMSRMVAGVSQNNEIGALTRYVMSSQCIAELINTLGLQMPPGLRASARQLKQQYPDRSLGDIETLLFVNATRQKLTVQNTGRDIITISAQHEDAEKAYLLCKTMAHIFIEESQKRQLGGIRGAREFSEEQLAIYEEKFRESQERLRKYQEEIIKYKMAATNLNPATLQRLRGEISSLEIGVRGKQDRIVQLKQYLRPLLEQRTLEKGRDVNNLEKDLFSIAAAIAENMVSFTWESPQLIKLSEDLSLYRDKIRLAYEEDLRLGVPDLQGHMRDQLISLFLTELDVRLLSYQKEQMNNWIANLEDSMSKQPAYEQKLQDLQQEVDQNRRLYQSFVNQSQGTQLEEEVQRKDAEYRLQIMEPANQPLYPEGFGRKIIMLISVALGFGLGIGLVVGLEFLDQSVKDVKEVEKKFNIPVWGVIPNLDDFRTPAWKREGMLYVVVFLGTVIAATLIVIVQKGSLL